MSRTLGPVAQPVRKLSLLAVLALNCWCVALAANPYQTAAQKYAAALLSYGRDHYGPVHTPMFVHTIDLRTLEIPRQTTPAAWRAEMSTWKEDPNYLMWGKDRSSMAWAQDSNLLWDTENIRLFYALSRDSGDPQYAQAADDYIGYFLRHCVSRTTGFFAWGEHIAYNVLDDQIHGKRHELQHPAPLWEELWKFNPDAVRNEIEAVYLYHITDKRSMAYDRHANYWNGMPERDQATILGYAGTYAKAFAFLYNKTGDPKYLDWARRLFLEFQSKSNDEGLYPDNWTDHQARGTPYQFAVNTSIALSLYQLYESTHDSLWLDEANQYLNGCYGRIARTLANSPNPFSTEYHGDVIGAPRDFIEAALKAYHWTGDARYLAMARQVGGAWAKMAQPKSQMASFLAERINAFASLYEATGEKQWLLAAQASGDYALSAFIHPSGFIRGTAIVDRPDYYDNIQGPGALALALYRLGSLRENASPIAPVAKPNDRQTPRISDWNFPPEASNSEPVSVSVRIALPSGVKRAQLTYTYGNEVGYQDTNPEVSGDLYTFHVAPPGISFMGEIAFAVQVTDASSGQNQTISPWHRLKVASVEQVRNVDGQWTFPTLGLTVSGTEPGGSLEARVTRWLPAGTSEPEKGWVSAGRYFTFDRTVHADRLQINYTPEETWRLIESTLSLAYWNGHVWVRVPSVLSSASHTVSGRFAASQYWTLVGEDRVLWRAPGRETGVALADLEGNDTFDVVTTVWQPGELLSSRGQSLQKFAIDPPYHPITNFSAPAVAHLTPGGDPLLLFGAPSGYVYAYDRAGKLHWRCEVGGEVLGAIAVGKLGAGPNLDVVASWNGGVAVIDADGHTRWQKAFPEPSGQTPVLMDLQGHGRDDVVLNVGSKIVALRGDDGAPLWEFSVPTGTFVTPAAGEFTRNGKPRIITGDDSGVVYALDENGKLLWRQDRVYGPREVPEPIDAYAGVAEIGMADLSHRGERQVIVTMKSGETVALSARGERLWRFASYERKVGISLGLGAHLAFADLDGDGKLEVILSQQDSYLYVLDSAGLEKWCYLGYFWYHTQPAVADLEHTGELNIVFTAPENDGTYALRSGHRGKPGAAPWPMTRGNLARTNCAPW